MPNHTRLEDVKFTGTAAQLAARVRGDLRARLKATGHTQDDVARACEVSKAAISHWFTGEISSPALDKAIPAYIVGLENGAAQPAA